MISEGRSDLTALWNNAVYLIESNVEQDGLDVLVHIKAKYYADTYTTYTSVYLIGINVDTERRKVEIRASETIER
ncbi:MAG: hypothetical protein NZL83_04525 [Candidatus Absconditabacterales bacterium]|nr:hypothetical protein [Candidatus Absconditabacterales bacterium]